MSDIISIQRKPFFAKACRVTLENLNDLALWCDGQIFEGDKEGQLSRKYIKVPVSHPANVRQTEAHLGDWIVKRGKTFKVYLDRPFRRSFELEGGGEFEAYEKPKQGAPSPKVMPQKRTEAPTPVPSEPVEVQPVPESAPVEANVAESGSDGRNSISLDELNRRADSQTPGQKFRGEM